MPDDIFDKVMAADGKGDIFDRVAAQQQGPSFLDAANQSKQQITSLPMQPSALGGAYPTTQQDQYINERLPMVNQRVADIRKDALSLAGASVGSGAVQGAGLLPSLLRIGGAGAGGAIGNVAGAVVSGQAPNPNEALRTGGSLALGQTGGEALSPFLKWLASSKSVGSKLLEQASAKAGNAPVEISAKTNEIVDKLATQSKLGGNLPKVITDFLDRVGPSTRHAADAEPGALTYDEARVLQSNASALSVSERLNLNGQLKYLVPQFAKSFGQDVQRAADQAGIGAEHAEGVREFAVASARNRALKNIGKAAIGGAGVYTAEQLIRKAASKAVGR